MSTIHTRIKKRREELGLTMKALAEKVGVSAWQTVQQWEREDGTAPKRDRLKAVAEALQTTSEELLFGPKSELFALETKIWDKKWNAPGRRSVEHLRDSLTDDGVRVGMAFDELTNSDQRESVVAQLRAFGVWK
jgi:transcriptional regulator with XRE-family HTH domain